MIAGVNSTFFSASNFGFIRNKKVQQKQSAPVNKTSNAFLPNYYVPLNFKGSSKVNRLLSNLEHNNAEPSALLEIEALNDAESRQFVKEYCVKTGFPNLKKVGSNMKNHAIDTINQAAYCAGVDILYAGFHKQCSAAVSLSLPGSDLDATGIILIGNQEQIFQFKNSLWNNFNPSIVSIRKDNEFPNVYSLDQLYEWTRAVDKIIKKEGLDGKEDKYTANLKEQDDFETALEFNIDIAKCISNYPKEEFETLAPSAAELLQFETPKNITQSMSSVLETLRSGHTLISKENLTLEQRKKIKSIENSYLYKYGNLCLQEAEYPVKQKLLERQKFINEESFSKLSLDEQKELILKILYESYPSWSKSDIEVDFGHKFDLLFANGDNINSSRDRAFKQTVDC